MMIRNSFLSQAGKFLALFFVFAAGLLSILATGGNNSSTTTVACTGPGQNVRTGSAVILDARCSDFTAAAPEDALLDYFWSIQDRPVGSSVALQSFLPVTRFIADVDGDYLVELTTGTRTGNDSSTTLLVVATTGNARPRVEAGPYQEVAVGDTVVLAGAGSDADDDGLSYSWSFNPASATEALSNPNAAVSGFVANQATDYLVDVTVNDGSAVSPTDTVSIRSKEANFSLPVAVAGPDQHVAVGSQVTLNGLGSYSAYDRPLSFEWRILTKPRASTASLAGSTDAQTQFTADLEGTYIIRLRVADGINDSSRSIDGVFEDRVVVFARDNRLPVADGGADRIVTTGVAVNLTGVASSDPEAATLTYAWSLYKAPLGSTATLSSVDSVDTQLTPDVSGDYLVRLVVNDGVDDSLPDIVRVSASGTTSGANPLTIVTSLPYTPPDAELLTRFLIDNDGSDELALDSSNDTQPADFDIAMQANANGLTNADFNAFPGWTIVSPLDPVLNEDQVEPTFILQRLADAVYYKLIVEFTVLDAELTVRVDDMHGWRCGIDQADCPGG